MYGDEFLGVMEFFAGSVCRADRRDLEMVAARRCPGRRVCSTAAGRARRTRERGAPVGDARDPRSMRSLRSTTPATSSSSTGGREGVRIHALRGGWGRLMADVIVPRNHARHSLGPGSGVTSRPAKPGCSVPAWRRARCEGMVRSSRSSFSIARVDDPDQRVLHGLHQGYHEACRRSAGTYRELPRRGRARGTHCSRVCCRRTSRESTIRTSRRATVPAAAGVVGGDFYDVFERGRGDWIMTIGELCGKGPDAAAATALSRLHDPGRSHGALQARATSWAC